MDLQKDVLFENVLFRGEEYTESKFLSKEFERCRFVNCNFTASQFIDCYFDACIFKNCNLSTARMNGCTFREVIVDGSKLIGILWYESKKRGFPLSITFKDSFLDYSSFFEMDLRKCFFDNVTAVEVDFSGADLSKVRLSKVRLSGAVFSHTNLKGTDFSQATDYLFNLAENQVKGASFSMPEALNLFYPFGVKISM